MLFVKVHKNNKKPSKWDASQLRWIARETGMNMDNFEKIEELRNFKTFYYSFYHLIGTIFEHVAATPLGHPKKMTKDDEIELMLFWGLEYRKKHVEVINKVQSISKKVDIADSLK